jgi:hypothetical protein
MMPLVGLGFTTSNAVTGERMPCDIHIFGGDDLNSRGATDSTEAYAFTNVGSGQGRIEISKKGFIPRIIPCNFPIQANIDFPMTPDGSIIPPENDDLHLEIKTNNFVNKDGRVVCYSGINQAIAYRMWLDKRFTELDALVKESHEFRFKWWSVYMQGSKNQNTIFDLNPNEPNYRPQLRPFGKYLNDNGIGLHAVIGVDNQDINSPYSHWTEVDDELNGLIYIYDGGNEADKNGFDPQLVPTPKTSAWSRGSATTDKLVPQNGASCASFHLRYDYPNLLTDAVASPVFMHDNGYTVCMATETQRFNLDGSNKAGLNNSPRLAFQLGSIYSAMWDFALFFNQSGQRGMLLTPQLRDIAFEYAKGFHG